jgi:hypothetical protein
MILKVCELSDGNIVIGRFKLKRKAWSLKKELVIEDFLNIYELKKNNITFISIDYYERFGSDKESCIIENLEKATDLIDKARRLMMGLQPIIIYDL